MDYRDVVAPYWVAEALYDGDTKLADMGDRVDPVGVFVEDGVYWIVGDVNGRRMTLPLSSLEDEPIFW